MKYITKMKLLFDSKMLAWREAGKEIRKEIRKGAFDMVFEEDDYNENISTVVPFLRHLFFYDALKDLVLDRLFKRFLKYIRMYLV